MPELLEPQIEPVSDLPEAETPSQQPPASKATQPAKPVKKRPSFFRRALRWLLFLLILFAAGYLLAVITTYKPMRDQYNAALKELEQANVQVNSLEGNLENLSPLERENQALQEKIQLAEMHTALLSARADVLAAQLALKDKDQARARVALTKTGKTLETLETLLPSDQQKVIADLQQRLKLSLEEMGENDYAAQSDLDVLANSLLELENALIGP
jgi:hypothetical protein